MTKRNPYLQHTYESFDQPSAQRRAPQNEGFEDGGPTIAERLRSPLFATVAVLLAGAALAGIIAISYPSKKSDENLPVVTADATPLREAPSDPGGMQVANQDSTVYDSVRSADRQETPPMENLLAAEQPVDKTTLPGAPAAVAAAPEASSAASVEPAAGDDTTAAAAPAATETADAATTASDAATKAATDEAGKVPPVRIAETKTIPVKSETIPLASATTSGTTPTLRPAGSNPETLAYVRSVLDNKDASAAAVASDEDSSSAPAATVEPAAGTASAATAKAIKPGNYFVQLASISSESAAPKEWAKLQKSFSSLGSAEYRVQKAALAKGTFFRIQAGPMSKDSAKGVCDSIKAQKPGGCIIVQ